MNLFSEEWEQRGPETSPGSLSVIIADADQQARQEASFREVAGQALVLLCSPRVQGDPCPCVITSVDV